MERACGWAIVVDDFAQSSPKRLEIFALDSYYLEAMSRQRLLDVEALQVLGGMTGDSDVVIVNDKFDVQALCDCKSGGFGIIALLLRAVGTEHKHGLLAVCKRNAIDEGPDMTETTRREFDAWGKSKLRMAGKLGVRFAVMKEMFGRDVTLDGGEEVLCGDAVPWISPSQLHAQMITRRAGEQHALRYTRNVQV